MLGVVDTHRASTQEEVDILGQLPLGDPHGGHETRDGHAGGALYVVVERAVLIAVLLEEPARV